MKLNAAVSSRSLKPLTHKRIFIAADRRAHIFKAVRHYGARFSVASPACAHVFRFEFFFLRSSSWTACTTRREYTAMNTRRICEYSADKTQKNRLKFETKFTSLPKPQCSWDKVPCLEALCGHWMILVKQSSYTGFSCVFNCALCVSVFLWCIFFDLCLFCKTVRCWCAAAYMAK